MLFLLKNQVTKAAKARLESRDGSLAIVRSQAKRA
jgi:hypothetical protein